MTAHVAVAGACAVRRDWLLKVLQTYPHDQPLTLAVVDGRLEMGRLTIPCSTAIELRQT